MHESDEIGKERRDWDLKGTIDLLRTTDDGWVVSYDVLTDKGHMTTSDT